MGSIKPMLQVNGERLPRAAIFLSGSGSNAERILERYREDPTPPLAIAALVTDRPDRSRAVELGSSFDLPVIAHDIKAFYHERGCRRITIATPEGRAIRAAWTDALRERLAPLGIDFGLFAGFVPLTNLTATLPCLNVHPGDLTYLKDGQRYLVGLHTVPIERAISEGLDHLRTSVILAESYSGKGDDMDSGPILGVSPKVPIDLRGHDLYELRQIAARRPAERPAGGYGDLLEAIAEHNQERLKIGGDWVVFPPVAWAFAEGRFGLDGSRLCYRQNGDWQPVQTVEFGPDGMRIIPV